MMYYKDGALTAVFMIGMCAGVAVTSAVSSSMYDAPIDPRLLRIADHVCRNNQGPKIIQPLHGDTFDIRCMDSALFQRVEAKFDDTPKVAGAALQETPREKELQNAK